MIIPSAHSDCLKRPPVEPSKPRTIRWPAVSLIAFIFMILNTGWIANSEMKTGVTEITISSLFIGVTFLLFLLTLGNLALRRCCGENTALTQAELMLIYSFLSISSVVAGVGHMGFFTPFLVNPFWYADHSNGWHGLWRWLPLYMGPRDPAILKGFYEGHSTVFRAAVLRAWAMPLLTWSIFFLGLLWTTLCLGIIVRRRWSEEEHLPFPVIVLPLEITRPGAPIYRNRLLWVGFAIPAFFHTLNSLASIYPSIPSWPINSARDLVLGLVFPWNGLEPTFRPIHPAGVGFGYLINTDVLFSLWFFYFLRKAFTFWGVLENWRDVGQGQFGDGAPQFPYLTYQAWGAWLALGLGILWQGRNYFSAYFRRALHPEPECTNGEPMSARTAVLGFLGGFLALCAFVWSSGGSWWLPVAFFGIYIILMLVLARLQAETAVVSPFLAWVDPQSILTTLSGTVGWTPMDSVHTGMLSWFNSDYRAAALPHQLQAFVGQERAGGTLRGVSGMLMLAAAIALFFSLLWDLQLYYVNGAATGHANQWRISEGSLPWTNVQTWIQHPVPPNKTALAGAAAGAAITGILTLFRNTFTGFPLSPAAYVLNTSWANDLFWLDMLIAWIAKATLLRYGGMKAYRLALPFFLGLILGDFVVGSVWSIIGMALHLNLFRTFST